VLCRDDYDEFFEYQPAMALLLEGLLLDRTFFFLGYGLPNSDSRRVQGRVGRILRDAQRSGEGRGVRLPDWLQDGLDAWAKLLHGGPRAPARVVLTLRPRQADPTPASVRPPDAARPGRAGLSSTSALLRVS
jgi:hypothetical protein